MEQLNKPKDESALIVSVESRKGGFGKTTTIFKTHNLRMITTSLISIKNIKSLNGGFCSVYCAKPAPTGLNIKRSQFYEE
jgi:hypothetical protein